MKMNENNIVRCSSCNAPLIYEELKDHICFTKKLVEARFDTNDNKVYAFDGKRWYRWFPPTQNSTPNSNTRRFNRTSVVVDSAAVSSFIVAGLRMFMHKVGFSS